MALLNIYGTGGFARQAFEPLLILLDSGPTIAGFDDLAFMEDGPSIVQLFDHPVRELDTAKSGELFLVAVGNSQIRQTLTKKCLAIGLTPFSLIANSAKVARHSKLGQGAVFLDHCIVESGASIGNGFQANVDCFVAHDCVIGDYVTFGPKACCNGNVHIGDHAYIGAGAIIKQGTPDKPLRIGKGAIVGMGAVVTKDVPDGAVVVGNPARIRD